MSEDTTTALRGLADNAVVVLAARMMAAIGVPIALGLFAWLATETVSTGKAVARLEVQMTYGVERSLKAMDTRLTRLENRRETVTLREDRRRDVPAFHDEPWNVPQQRGGNGGN